MKKEKKSNGQEVSKEDIVENGILLYLHHE